MDVAQPQPAPRRLAGEVEYVVRLLGLAADYLEGEKGHARAAFRPIELARKTLDDALAGDVDAATAELAPVVRRALGRNVGEAEIYGARRALELLLGWLPDLPPAAHLHSVNGAAATRHSTNKTRPG